MVLPGLWWGVPATLTRRHFFGLSTLLALLLCGRSRGQPAPAAVREVILATTTSTQDSGLLGALLPEFEKAKGIRVKVVAVGTGEALALGARGDADILLVGPVSDPAQVRGRGCVAASRQIHETGNRYASRGDKSGTHKTELDPWKTQAWSHRVSPGTCPPTRARAKPRVANEKQAYTLIDRGTCLSMKSSLQLVVISEGDPSLFNPFGAIVVGAQKLPKVHEAEAKQLAEWLVSAETQRKIGAFGREKYGQALFVPDAIPDRGGRKRRWRSHHPGEAAIGWQRAVRLWSG